MLSEKDFLEAIEEIDKIDNASLKIEEALKDISEGLARFNLHTPSNMIEKLLVKNMADIRGEEETAITIAYAFEMKEFPVEWEDPYTKKKFVCKNWSDIYRYLKGDDLNENV